MMRRALMLDSVRQRAEPWDLVVIGGGATGAGCALDAAARGLAVLLVEQADFGKGTSSRSTKLIHGGVRYLRQGNVSLVREALLERFHLLQNAPHVVTPLRFVIPCYLRLDLATYRTGLGVYDMMSRPHGVGKVRKLSADETIELLPGIAGERLIGGVEFWDARFDDSRLLIDILSTAVSYGATVLNYVGATSFQTDAGGRLNAVELTDQRSGERLRVATRSVINATGVFSDAVRRMSEPSAADLIAFAQGIHVVLPRRFLSGEAALTIPKTRDGRVLFCIPWHQHLLVGTTDTPVAAAHLEPRPLDAEIEFVLETATGYLNEKPTRADILSSFAGIRPLVARAGTAKTSSLSRGHEMFVDSSGLITITGGKWTTYRRMAEDAVDRAVEIAGVRAGNCSTESLKIREPERAFGDRIHPMFEYTTGDVARAVREEMAVCLEDVIARRTRFLFIDARAAIEIAPKVAAIMAAEMSHGQDWIDAEIARFRRLAAGYLAA